jgi:hypothetical protein
LKKTLFKSTSPLNIAYISEAVGGMVSVRGNLEAFFSLHLSLLCSCEWDGIAQSV